MKRLMTLGMAIAAALAIAACGGGGSSGSAASAAGSTTGSTTVSVRQLAGIGNVLVDSTGKALYANNLESAGKILCNDPACNAFWMPLTLAGGKPSAPAGVGKLGVIKRPDGSTQLTASGKPLYTFSEDSPGKVNGNGFQDQFGGHNFTWNAVRPSGTTVSGAAPGTSAATPSGAGGAASGYSY